MARLNIDASPDLMQRVVEFATQQGILTHTGEPNRSRAGLMLIEQGLNTSSNTGEEKSLREEIARLRQITEAMGVSPESGLNGLVGNMVNSQMTSHRLQELESNYKETRDDLKKLKEERDKLKEELDREREALKKQSRVVDVIERLAPVVTQAALTHVDKNPKGLAGQALSGVLGIEPEQGAIEGGNEATQIGQMFLEAFPGELFPKAYNAMAVLQQNPGEIDVLLEKHSSND